MAVSCPARRYHDLGTLEFLHVGKWLRPCGYELFQPLFVWRYRGVDDSLYLGYPADEEQPAYKHIILQPRIGGTFSFIRGHYDSAYGRIESGWQIQKKGYIYEATIPANTTAILYLPAKSEKSVRMEKGQEGITSVGLKDGKAVYRLRSGSYRICVD